MEDGAASPLSGEESAVVQDPQMLGCHVAGDAAGLGQLAHGVLGLQQHLNDAQSVRMGDGPKALRGLFHGGQGGEFRR